MFDSIRYLLLQVRNAADPMRQQEVGCFSRALRTPPENIHVFDLLSGVPDVALLDTVDVVLLGGSGDYSVAEGGPWLPAALEAMRELFELSKPTFASCWGFQAMAKALGGEVVTDISRAELGTIEVQLTPAGRSDPVFASLPDRFGTIMGHQDIVTRLPTGATLLASSERVENQAFCFAGKPIYCTQFHPELDRTGLLERLAAYPRYVESIAGMSMTDFKEHCADEPQTASLLPRYVERFFAGQ